MERPELTDPKLTENALAILEKRYFRKDADGNIVEDWSELCDRVANYVAQAEPEGERERWTKAFYTMIHSLIFLPNSPTLFNANMPLGNLSACFVLPIDDSLDKIFDTLGNAAKIFASGGGCGYDFSELRKRGSPVSRTNGVSSGPVSFIHVYNAATDVIKQGGKRRGANMGVLRVDHPDIEEFIDAKIEEGALANFNLSVAVTDEFIQAVEDDVDFSLFDNYLDKPDRTVRARDLFAKIVDHAWSNGEPGIIFLDEVNRKHSLQGLGEIVGVNPCGEQPLLPNESCNLGSINLTRFYDKKADEYTFNSIDWDSLARVVSDAVRFLDDVATMNKFPVEAIEEATLQTRKIGLGVMGWADLLLMLNIKYDSDDAVELAGLMMEWIQYHALMASVELAKERGRFPTFEHYCSPERGVRGKTGGRARGCEGWDTLDVFIQKYGLRNACVTTVAPTGSLSLIAGVSSGIEPNFQWEYTYNRVDREFTEKHQIAARYLDAGAPLPGYFVTALEIEPIWHIKMQAAWQEWVDAGISKTINLPFEATKEDVHNAILAAWHLKCKGITLYRSGSRQREVLVAKGQKQEGTPEAAVSVSPRERPLRTHGSTMKIRVGDDCGTMFVTVNSDEKGPCECFVNLGRGGGCISSHSEALGRTVSLALRSGIDPKEIVDQLSGIRCSKIRWMEGEALRSCPDAVAFALDRILSGNSVGTSEDVPLDSNTVRSTLQRSAASFGENPECPECSSMLFIEGHCVVCRGCGYSKCG